MPPVLFLLLGGLGWLALRGTSKRSAGADGARSRPEGTVFDNLVDDAVDAAEELVSKQDDNPAHLDPTFRATLDAVFDELRAKGWEPKLFEGYRSAERQAALKADGKSKVSWSYHQYTRGGVPAALAADVIEAKHGWSSDPFFADLQAAAEARGLESGNAWKWRDAAHVQAAPSTQITAIREGADPGPYLAKLTT